jgi:hypothetical protein
MLSPPMQPICCDVYSYYILLSHHQEKALKYSSFRSKFPLFSERLFNFNGLNTLYRATIDKLTYNKEL